ncbi:hypothetical protein G6730_00080 [Polynucleobacter paneuropaeus]|nr:hypothetical protein [Polynucleobacter paneuropaeus]
MKKTKSVAKKSNVKKIAVKAKQSAVKKPAMKVKQVVKKLATKKVVMKTKAVSKAAGDKNPKEKKEVRPISSKEPTLTPNTIFVQIASYRDPELIPTIQDCIAKAKHPENLRFGICRQFHELDEFDNLDQYRNDPRFTIEDIPWHETLGLCWARAKIQKLYQGEKYTLQLDSHHRFVQDWDDILINMMGQIKAPKPLITAYCPGYDPAQPELDWSQAALKMRPAHFTSYGTIAFLPQYIENAHKISAPIPARFVSGHFFFTLGEHCLEYKYDPQIYFAGDEISLSIRSYTLGYDLFHPNQSVVAHNYRSYARPLHWDDHLKTNSTEVAQDWFETNEKGLKRLRQMLREEDNGIDLGEYDIGSVRSHAQYEAYAGVDFARKKIHPFALFGFEPPTTSDANWGRHQATYERQISWEDVKSEILVENVAQVYVGFDGPDGVIHAEFIKDAEVLAGTKTSQKFSFLYDQLPLKVVFFGLNKDNVWGNRVEKSL